MTVERLADVLAAGSVCGVFQWAGDTVAEVELHSAAAKGWTVGVVQLAAARSKAELFAAFQRDLGFPKWFGHNWDALVDALADWHGHAARRLLVVEGVQSHDHGYPVDPLIDVVTVVSAIPAMPTTPLPIVAATSPDSGVWVASGVPEARADGKVGQRRFVVLLTSPHALDGVPSFA